MKRSIIICSIIALACSSSQAKIDLVTLPSRDSVRLTIYNSANLTLVRESRALTLKQGYNKLQFSWENTLIDPTSLEMISRTVGDGISVDDLTYPARVRNLGLWNVESKVSGKVPVEITYLTSGLSWRAFYMGTLTKDEKTMHLQGYVRVTNNSGEDYEDAQVRLIVGKVHIIDEIAGLARRQYPYDRPGLEENSQLSLARGQEASVQLKRRLVTLDERMIYAGAMVGKPPEIKKEGLSEYFLYTIEGTDTIPTGWSKRLLSFEAKDVSVVNLYKFEQERYGDSPVRFLSFKNDTEHKLGKTPIPGGLLKVYRTIDTQNHLSYTGQSDFKYIPVNEDVELNLGPAADVIVEPTLIDFKTQNYQFDRNNDISSWDEVSTFRVNVKNTRDLPIKVEITRNFGIPQWNLTHSGDTGKYEKVDIDTVKFTLMLEPRTATEFQYVLTVQKEIVRPETSQNASTFAERFANNQVAIVQNGLQFTGDDLHVIIPDNPALDLTGPLTLESWIKFQPGGTLNPRIISKGWESQTGYELLLLGTGEMRHFQFAAKNIGRFNSSSELNANVWHHIAATYDERAVRLFFNGRQDAAYEAQGRIRTNDVPLQIGRNSQTDADLYKGEIADVRIWGRIVPEDEIRQNLLGLPQNQTSLAGYWDFRQYRSADMVPDISPNRNNARIIRAAQPRSRR